MKGEIKFRAWDTDENRWYPHERGEWINICRDGSIVYGYEDGEIFEGDGRFEITQFTGLLDKNGKEIYEGDIVTEGYLEYEVKLMQTDHWTGFKKVTGDSVTDMGKEQSGRLEVIGNIYEGVSK